MNTNARHALATGFSAVQARHSVSASLQIHGRHEPWVAKASSKQLRRAASTTTVLRRQLVTRRQCSIVSVGSVVGATLPTQTEPGFSAPSRKAEASRLKARCAAVLPLRATQVSRSHLSCDGPRFYVLGRLWPNSSVEGTNNGGSHLRACQSTAAVVCPSPLRWASVEAPSGNATEPFVRCGACEQKE